MAIGVTNTVIFARDYRPLAANPTGLRQAMTTIRGTPNEGALERTGFGIKSG